ncbi:MAG: AraC family transcriptional regulator [Collinsella sp.]
MQSYEAALLQTDAPALPSAQVAAAMSYIERHACDCTLDDLAHHLHLSPNYASALLKRQTGRTFMQLVQESRLTRGGSTRHRCYCRGRSAQWGYANVSFFYKKFAERYGCMRPPTAGVCPDQTFQNKPALCWSVSGSVRDGTAAVRGREKSVGFGAPASARPVRRRTRIIDPRYKGDAHGKHQVPQGFLLGWRHRRHQLRRLERGRPRSFRRRPFLGRQLQGATSDYDRHRPQPLLPQS